jgi:hypothetical protein
MRGAALILMPLVVAVVVVLAASRLLPACAVAGVAWLQACPPADDTAAPGRPAALAAERARLEAEIEGLQRRVAALPDCTVVAEAPLPEPSPPVAAAPPEIVPTPRPARRPPPPPPPQQPARDIEEERWNNRDISLLEGCWDLESNFETVEAGNRRYPVSSWQMCFDAQGNGEQNFVAFRERKPCAGPVRGAFQPAGQMSIDFVRDARCRPQGTIVRRNSTCVLTPDGRAQCTSIRASDRLRQTFTLRRRR